jgi:AcrR family transcriptional regulator
MAALTRPAGPRRPYDSPLRRQRAAETRDRIVAAGAELLHGFPVWNWRALTVRAVAQRAGVNERTVYRHFPTEKDLRDAVMTRLEEEAGVELEGLRLERVQEVATRILEYVSSFPIESRTPRDPTVVATNARQREALLDVLWSPVSFERMVTDWTLDPKDAIAGITWAIGLIQHALAEGPRPRD